jgi:hypothetical protein
MKVKCGDGTMKDGVIICNHVAAGALIANLVSPFDSEDGIGEAVCARCAAVPSEDVNDYASACWDCVRKRIQ